MLTKHLVGIPSGIDKHAISSFIRTQDSLSALLGLKCVCVLVTSVQFSRSVMSDSL